MPFTPDAPFPKTSGNPIRSKDWNDAITEVQRLDTAKANRAGDTFTGLLSAQAGIRTDGSFSMGGNGTFRIDAPGVVGGRLSVTDAGTASRVGIDQPNPQSTLDVNGTLSVTGDASLRANLDLAGSEMHFTKTDHEWRPTSDVLGQASIQNARTNNTLMIVGRTVTVNPLHRVVGLWDELNVWGRLTVAGDLAVDAQITSPMFGVEQLLNNRAGGLPLDANFVTAGGVIVMFASGSGWNPSANPVWAQIGMVVRVDNTDRASVMSFTNEQNSHKAFCSNAIVIAGLRAGGHKLELAARPGTSTDYNDFFSVTVLELPFTGAR